MLWNPHTVLPIGKAGAMQSSVRQRNRVHARLIVLDTMNCPTRTIQKSKHHRQAGVLARRLYTSLYGQLYLRQYLLI